MRLWFKDLKPKPTSPTPSARWSSYLTPTTSSRSKQTSSEASEAPTSHSETALHIQMCRVSIKMSCSIRCLLLSSTPLTINLMQIKYKTGLKATTLLPLHRTWRSLLNSWTTASPLVTRRRTCNLAHLPFRLGQPISCRLPCSTTKSSTTEREKGSELEPSEWATTKNRRTSENEW